MGTCSNCGGKGDVVINEWKCFRTVETCKKCGGSGSTSDYRTCSCGTTKRRGTSGTWYCKNCDGHPHSDF